MSDYRGTRISQVPDYRGSTVLYLFIIVLIQIILVVVY